MQTMRKMPPLLTVAEVASALRVAPSTVYRLARTGEIPCVTFGGCVRVPAYALEEIVGAAHESEETS